MTDRVYIFADGRPYGPFCKISDRSRRSIENFIPPTGSSNHVENKSHKNTFFTANPLSNSASTSPLPTHSSALPNHKPRSRIEILKDSGKFEEILAKLFDEKPQLKMAGDRNKVLASPAFSAPTRAPRVFNSGNGKIPPPTGTSSGRKFGVNPSAVPTTTTTTTRPKLTLKV